MEAVAQSAFNIFESGWPAKGAEEPEWTEWNLSDASENS